MADALQRVIAVWADFTTITEKSATAFFTTFVASGRRGVRSGIKHSSHAQGIVLISTARCGVGACVFFSHHHQQQQQSSRGEYLPEGTAAAERGFILTKWRQEWAVSKAYNAFCRARPGPT